MTFIFIQLIVSYLLVLLSIYCHELAHYLTAKMYHFQVERLVIGSEHFAVKYKNNRFSILPLHGYISVPETSLQNKSEKEKKALFLAGPNMNLILAGIFTLLNIKLFSPALCAAIAFNLAIGLLNCFPVIPGNDILNYRQYRHVK